MATKDTVLIIGAGASKPYGFPTASELGPMITGEMPESFRHLRYNDVFHAHIGSWQKFLETCFVPTSEARHPADFLRMQKQFKESEIYSIDRFSFLHPHYEGMARYFIALILLLCERQSELKGGWYRALWNDVLNPAVEDNEGPLEIVSFNYDRSFEEYIRRVAKAAYPGRENDVHNTLKVSHVYGSFGPVGIGEKLVEYGEPSSFETSAPHIKLIPPRAEANGDLGDLIASKNKAVFLGFGFDELNLRVLGIHAGRRPKQIFASRLGLSKRLEKAAEETLGEIVWGDPSQDVEKFIHQSEAFA
jgi:hypothetical protein